MSQWTGWEHRTGIEEVPVSQDDIAPPSEWSWDRYLAEGYSEDHVDAVRYVVERLEQMEELESRRFKLWIKFHPRSAAEKTDRTKVAEITWYHRIPRLYVHRVGDAVPETMDPLPQLKGKKVPNKHWFWTLPPEVTGLDLEALIGFVRDHANSALEVESVS